MSGKEKKHSAAADAQEDRQADQAEGQRIRIEEDLGVGCGSTELLQAVWRGHKASNRVCDP